MLRGRQQQQQQQAAPQSPLPETPAPSPAVAAVSDGGRFAARSAAVQALETAVAAGGAGMGDGASQARGRKVPGNVQEWTYDIDLHFAQETQAELTVRGKECCVHVDMWRSAGEFHANAFNFAGLRLG